MSEDNVGGLIVRESCEAVSGKMAEQQNMDEQEAKEQCKDVMIQIAEENVSPEEMGDRINQELGEGTFEVIQDMFADAAGLD